MLNRIKKKAERIFGKKNDPNVKVKWVKKAPNSWLANHFEGEVFTPLVTAFSKKIEALAAQTNKEGPQPLWEGYSEDNIAGPTRMPNSVRTVAMMGNLYTDMVTHRKPEILVEFGTAFGVSGMYFMAGMMANGKGQLLTFDPNDVWRNFAMANLSQIGDRFTSVSGTFEENIDSVLEEGQRIDMAFIDAIHTKEFVMPQLEIVVSKSNDKAIIILDDINFEGNMRECWDEVAQDPRFCSSVELGERVGVVELN